MKLNRDASQRQILLLFDESSVAFMLGGLMFAFSNNWLSTVCSFVLFGVGIFCIGYGLKKKLQLKQQGKWRTLKTHELFTFPELWKKEI